MKLNPQWRALLKKAWSIRFMALSMVFLGIEAIVPLFMDILPRGVFAGLTFASIVAGGASRLFLQNGLPGPPSSGDRDAETGP